MLLPLRMYNNMDDARAMFSELWINDALGWLGLLLAKS